MRYTTVVLTPEGGGFHPIDRTIAQEPSVAREAIHHINRLDDGSGVLLYGLRGDAASVRGILEGRPELIAWDVSKVAEGIHVFLHFEPGDTAGQLLELTQHHELVLDTPVECTPDGGLRVTAIADENTLQRAIAAIPDDVSVELEGTGEYQPERDRLVGLLTERQREILRAALAAGYYEEPREVTYADLAEELDLSPATVGEHLRRIEGKVLREIGV